MALYDRSITKGMYTEYGTREDVCFFCKKNNNLKVLKKEMSVDEGLMANRKLKGVLENKRVLKVSFLGNSFCICKNCVENAVMEMGINIKASNSILEAVENISIDDIPVLDGPNILAEDAKKTIENMTKPRKNNKGSAKNVSTKES